MRCEICGQDFDYTKLKNVGGRALCIGCFAAKQLQKYQRDAELRKVSKAPKDAMATSIVFKNAIAGLAILALLGIIGLQFLPTSSHPRPNEPAPVEPKPPVANSASVAIENAPKAVPAVARISGEAWFQTTQGSIIVIAADEILLLPRLIAVDPTDRDFARGAEEIKSRKEEMDAKPGDSEAKRLQKMQMGTDDARMYPWVTEAIASRSIVAVRLAKLSQLLVAEDPTILLTAMGRPANADDLSAVLRRDHFWNYLQGKVIRTATTDREGRFSFENLPMGQYAVVYRQHKPGFRSIIYWAEPVDLEAKNDIRLQLTNKNAFVVSYH